MTKQNDEKKPEDSIELSIDDLEDAAGGYLLVRDGVSCPYAVIDDETGKIRWNTNNLEEAKWKIEQLGISDQRIDYEEYQQKFGRRFRI